MDRPQKGGKGDIRAKRLEGKRGPDRLLISNEERSNKASSVVARSMAGKFALVNPWGSPRKAGRGGSSGGIRPNC